MPRMQVCCRILCFGGFHFRYYYLKKKIFPGRAMEWTRILIEQHSTPDKAIIEFNIFTVVNIF